MSTLVISMNIERGTIDMNMQSEPGIITISQSSAEL